MSLKAANSLLLPLDGNVFEVTGKRKVFRMRGGYNGRQVILKFPDSGFVGKERPKTPYLGRPNKFYKDSFDICGNYTAPAGGMFTIVYDGTTWAEVARSYN